MRIDERLPEGFSIEQIEIRLLFNIHPNSSYGVAANDFLPRLLIKYATDNIVMFANNIVGLWLLVIRIVEVGENNYLALNTNTIKFIIILKVS